MPVEGEKPESDGSPHIAALLEEKIAEAIRGGLLNILGIESHAGETITFKIILHEGIIHNATGTGEHVPNYSMAIMSYMGDGAMHTGNHGTLLRQSSILSDSSVNADLTVLRVPSHDHHSIDALSFDSSLHSGDCVPHHRDRTEYTVAFDKTMMATGSIPHHRVVSIDTISFVVSDSTGINVPGVRSVPEETLTFSIACATGNSVPNSRLKPSKAHRHVEIFFMRIIGLSAIPNSADMENVISHAFAGMVEVHVIVGGRQDPGITTETILVEAEISDVMDTIIISVTSYGMAAVGHEGITEKKGPEHRKEGLEDDAYLAMASIDDATVCALSSEFEIIHPPYAHVMDSSGITHGEDKLPIMSEDIIGTLLTNNDMNGEKAAHNS